MHRTTPINFSLINSIYGYIAGLQKQQAAFSFNETSPGRIDNLNESRLM